MVGLAQQGRGEYLKPRASGSQGVAGVVSTVDQCRDHGRDTAFQACPSRASTSHRRADCRTMALTLAQAEGVPAVCLAPG